MAAAGMAAPSAVDTRAPGQTCWAVPRHRWPDGASLDDWQVQALHEGRHEDPGYVLGCHSLPCGRLVVRVWHGALDSPRGDVFLLWEAANVRVPMTRRCAWLYETVFELPGGLSDRSAVYRLEVVEPMHYGCHATGIRSQLLYDAYAHTQALVSDDDVARIHAGFCPRIADVMGCHGLLVDGVFGLRFVAWAPKAQLVAVVGDFNGWDGRAHPMRRRRNALGGFTGLWELFLPAGMRRGDVPLRSKYMFRIRGADGRESLKIDPFAQEFEAPPFHASVVSACDEAFLREPFLWEDAAWLARRRSLGLSGELRRRPMAIYEVHLPSWRHSPDGDVMNYRELAPLLVEHMLALHFNYLELLPLAHHPCESSRGCPVTGQYAVYSRLGSPDDFKFFVNEMHKAGIGVIMDFVPAHFCKDSWALADFDGGATFEYEDPKEAELKEWGTRVFNFGKHEVRAYLLGAALFWVDRYHVDGFRVDGVPAMLYKNFGRAEGEWVPNQDGGECNMDALSLLRELNQRIRVAHPGVVMCADECTAWSGVTKGCDHTTGLGFDFKWDSGWTDDTLSYLASRAEERPGSHDKLTFRGLYMQHERWILPLSHDEVVSGKGSMLEKMGCLDNAPFERKLRLLRALYGFQVGSPGRPLLFMGGEIGQGREWDCARPVDWQQGEEELRSKLCTFVSDLMGVYVWHRPLHAGDDEPHGKDEYMGSWRSFEWAEVENREACLVAFLRYWAADRAVLVVCNFSPQEHRCYALGVPFGGSWRVLLNSDDWRYGGAGAGPCNQSELETTPNGRWGWPACLWLDIPAESCLLLLGPEQHLDCIIKPKALEAAAECAPETA